MSAVLNQEEQAVHILLVEDDPGHARLIERGLKRAGINNPLTVLSDGQMAVDYLFERKEDLRPTLILLDLNLPLLSGYQVLERIKQEESLQHVPVIILTTTDDLREVSRCYALGCNVYITKPVAYEDFSEALRKLGLFLTIVQIPESKGESGQ
jgi:CheY-like chemotaxis protein